MAQYYKLMSHGVTLAEYWRLSNSFAEFLLYLKIKYILPPMPLGTGMGRPDRLDFLQADQVPIRALRAIGTYATQLAKAGFVTGFYYTIPVLGAQESYAVALLGRDSKIAASVVYGRQRNEVVEMEQTICGFATELVNGPILSTVNSKHTLNTPPGVKSEKYPGMSVGDLLARHQRRLVNLSPSETCHWRNVNELADFALKVNLNEFDEFIRRGIYQPMTPEEVVLQQRAHTEFLRRT